MKTSFLILFLFAFSFWAGAQNKFEITLSGYADYYSSSFDNLTEEDNQPLTTVGAKPSRFANNISTFGINVKHKYFRSQFTGHSGRIIKATWDSDLSNIQEAYVGLHLFPDFYLDAGYFATHIGMESFMPKNNLLSSTSIITYNEPFYQRGARLVYEGLENFEFQLWLLDGYNLFRDNNDTKSIGFLGSYEKGDFALSYSNIIGPEPIDGQGDALRTYHNLYTNYTFLRDIFELQLSTDFATQAEVGLIEQKFMIAYIAALRINITPRLSVTGRYEHQNDKNSMIGGRYLENSQGFPASYSGIEMDGYTAGVAYEVGGLYIRYEVRQLSDRLKTLQVFDRSNKRIEQLFTIGLSFDAKIKW